MRRRELPVLTLTLALALALPVLALTLASPDATAQGDTIVLQATREACPDGRTYCFAGQEQALLDPEPGTPVTVRFSNLDTTVHNLYVATPADGHEERSTDPEAAIAGTPESVPPSTNATFQLTLPEGTTSYYLWCDITGHERLGMWVEVDLSQRRVTGLAAPRDGPAATPGFGAWAGLLALLGAVALSRTPPRS